MGVFSADLEQVYQDNGYNVLRVSSTEMMAYKPWGAFETLFRDYFKLSCHNDLIDLKTINPTILKKFQALFDFIQGKTIKALTPEDARFAYMEQWCNFLSILKNTVVVFDSFENLDDTTIQTLELYFDKFKNIVPNFLFVKSKALIIPNPLRLFLCNLVKLCPILPAKFLIYQRQICISHRGCKRKHEDNLCCAIREMRAIKENVRF